MESPGSTPSDPLDEIYGGTRGHSGSDASRDAAEADLTKGVTNVTQKYVLVLAQQMGARGITVAEAREKDGKLHHGRISSAITKQHIAGRLVALTERRGNCGVYVLPEHVNGREVRPYRRQKRKITDEMVDAAAKALIHADPSQPWPPREAWGGIVALGAHVGDEDELLDFARAALEAAWEVMD